MDKNENLTNNEILELAKSDIREIYNKFNVDLDTDSEKEIDKETYKEFYQLLNKFIMNIILDSYKAYFYNKNFTEETYDGEKINDILNEHEEEHIVSHLQTCLNMYWIDDESNLGTSITNLGIVTHKGCLFNLVKQNSIYIIKEINKVKFNNIETFEKFMHKLIEMIGTILNILKETSIEDDDDIECDKECVFRELYKKKIFW